MSSFQKVVTNKYFATIITLVLAYLLTKVGYAEIWPLFGSANQLLSVLALVACAVFLKKTKRQGWMLWVPMVFMMAVTFTALGMTIVKLSKAFVTTGLDLGNSLQLIFAVLLLILGVLVAIQGIKKLLENQRLKKQQNGHNKNNPVTKQVPYAVYFTDCAGGLFLYGFRLFKMSTHRVDTLNFYLLPVINFLLKYRKKIILSKIPTSVEAGAARPIFVRLASG